MHRIRCRQFLNVSVRKGGNVSEEEGRLHYFSGKTVPAHGYLHSKVSVNSKLQMKTKFPVQS